MSLYDDHVTHDKQLRSLISQVTNGRRRGAIVDKELSLNGVTLLCDLVPISDPPLLQKNTQDLRSAPG